MTIKYDLLIKGGKVIDASQGLEEVRDVAFAKGKVGAVAYQIPEAEAREVYDARGKIVTPGLIDIHSHFYYGVDAFSVDSRSEFLPTGVTCAVDGGSAGAAIYPGLRDLIIKPSKLHLYAFLNVLTHGLPGLFLAMSLQYRVLDQANVESAVKMIQSNRDTIVGIKLIFQLRDYSDPGDYLPLMQRSVEIAEETQCPILCHIGGGKYSLSLLADHLRPGDIITHCFHSDEPNIIGENGKVRSEIVEAVNKGIILDIAPAGNAHMDWKIAEAAAKEGLWPQIISTDYAPLGMGVVEMYTIPDLMSIMMNLGMPLAKVVEAATSKPAAVIGKADKHGSLKPGATGDAAVLEIQSGQHSYLAMNNERRTFDKRLVTVKTVLRGKMWQAPRKKGK